VLQGLIDRLRQEDWQARSELLERAHTRLRKMANRMLSQSFPAQGCRHDLDTVVHEPGEGGRSRIAIRIRYAVRLPASLPAPPTAALDQSRAIWLDFVINHPLRREVQTLVVNGSKT
jgi:hypothetical protein